MFVAVEAVMEETQPSSKDAPAPAAVSPPASDPALLNKKDPAADKEDTHWLHCTLFEYPTSKSSLYQNHIFKSSACLLVDKKGKIQLQSQQFQ